MKNELLQDQIAKYQNDGFVVIEDGIQNILSDEQIAHFKVGNLLNDDQQNPSIYSSANAFGGTAVTV